MSSVYFYEGIIGRYALQDTDGRLTRMWVGDRVPSPADGLFVEETALLREAKRELDAYFAGRLREFSVPLAPRGTAFQERVWQELRRIPYGQTITYGELARRIGAPQAARAVGMANGRNPLPVFIPCHRVVGAGNKLVGYTGGLDVKIALLSVEGCHQLR